MKQILFLTACVCCYSFILVSTPKSDFKSISVYPIKPEDPEAVYFTNENYPIDTQGKGDVADALQGAINHLKTNHNFGIIFIPEGKYLISKTIYIPGAIRIIGYGKNRPLFILGKNSPGYQVPDQNDKGKANYMFWFTSGPVEPGQRIRDAGAGTFYSALSNIDIIIEDGNPEAVALRTHYAQHSFVSHCDIHIGNGKAGLFDVGNEMEDVRFFGGDYGIYTTKASPGWQFMMLDTYFEGQRKAAIKTHEAGLTIVRMQAKDVPAVVTIDKNYWEKLIMEDCQFVNVSGPAITICNEGNANTQISLRNIDCNNVPILAWFQNSNQQKPGAGPIFKVKNLLYGLQIDDLDKEPKINTIFDCDILKAMPSPSKKDIPDLPAMNTWVNLKSLGAKGDGETDDTKIIQNVIDTYPTIYVPQGWYRVSNTIKLKPNSVLIGLSPIATQFIIAENENAFSGFGAPKPLIETPLGGNNTLTGIGLSTGEYNYRAVACKWMAGENSMMNDVKFMGGHGTMERKPYVPRRGENRPGKPTPIPGVDPAWDTQYWSLWITNEGGGIFKNIWSASSYATSGIYISHTSTRGRIYAMSVEHHVRNEIRFNSVSNWKVYALQLEEESREGLNCQPMEIENCDHMVFANLYLFRVIRFKTPYPYSVRTWNCSNIEFLNVHNYSQIKYTTDNPLYDMRTGIEIRPWEFNRLFISDKVFRNNHSANSTGIVKLAGGFEFAEGTCSDSKGNVYFCEQRMKRIYKWSAESNSLILLADFAWEPLSLACDSKDNLLVVFKYNPQPGFLVNGKSEAFENPADANGTSFSGWGNSGFGTLLYTMDPEHPDETIHLLEKVKMNTVTNVFKALYPSNRWRDFHDFDSVSVNRNEECFIAPDGVTIIPVCYDLARACNLVEAYPGKGLYAVDEYDKRTVQYDVDTQGYLYNLKYFTEKGEFGIASDKSGNIYIADGDIYVYDKSGAQKNVIKVPERPTSIIFGGKDGKTLFITGRTSLYSTQN